MCLGQLGQGFIRLGDSCFIRTNTASPQFNRFITEQTAAAAVSESQSPLEITSSSGGGAITLLRSKKVQYWCINIKMGMIHYYHYLFLSVQELYKPWREKSVMRSSWVRLTGRCQPLSSRGRRWRTLTPTQKCLRTWALPPRHCRVHTNTCKRHISKVVVNLQRNIPKRKPMHELRCPSESLSLFVSSLFCPFIFSLGGQRI